MPCCAKAPTNNSGNGFRVFINGSDTTQLVSELKDAGAKVVSFDRQYVPLNGSMLSVAHLADDEKHEMLELAANQLASQGHMVVVTDNRLAGSNCVRVFSHTSLPQVNSVEHAERWSTLYEPALEPTHIVEHLSLEDLHNHVSTLSRRNHKRQALFDLMASNMSLNDGVGKVYLAPREQHHVLFNSNADSVDGKMLFDFLKEQNAIHGTDFFGWKDIKAGVKKIASSAKTAVSNVVAKVINKCAPKNSPTSNDGYNRSMIIEMGWLSCAAYQSESAVTKLFTGERTQSAGQTTKMWTFLEFYDSNKTGVCSNLIKATCPDTQGFAVQDVKSGIIAIVFRGTEKTSLGDIATDLTMTSINDPSISFGNKSAKISSGFFTAYKSIQDQIENLLADMGEDATEIWVSGHSLGGALATVCAAHIATTYPNFRSKLHMANFGSPKVGNSKFAKSFNAAVPFAFRVVNAKDAITTLPPVLKHVDHELHYFEGSWYRDVNPAFLTLPKLSDHSICQSQSQLGSCSFNSQSQNYTCSLSILPNSWSEFKTCY